MRINSTLYLLLSVMLVTSFGYILRCSIDIPSEIRVFPGDSVINLKVTMKYGLYGDLNESKLSQPCNGTFTIVQLEKKVQNPKQKNCVVTSPFSSFEEQLSFEYLVSDRDFEIGQTIHFKGQAQSKTQNAECSASMLIKYYRDPCNSGKCSGNCCEACQNPKDCFDNTMTGQCLWNEDRCVFFKTTSVIVK